MYPGLAVALHLRANNPWIKVTFAVEGRDFEKELVTSHQFDCVEIPAEPVPYDPVRMFRFLTRNWAGYREASQFLEENHVSVVVGLGGYVSVPMCRAAGQHDVPLVLLEQNAVAGRATRWMAGSADQVCVSFPHVRKHLPVGSRIHVTGNPVRPEIAALGQYRQAEPDAARPSDKKRGLLVLGGSQGSHALNQALPFALYHLRPRVENWHILHQTGKDEVEATRRLYHKFGLSATVLPYIRDMGSVLRHVDLAVCRAGGTTMAELACAGIPALLVPLPTATDNHQYKNARAFAAGGGCRLFSSRDESKRFDYGLARSLVPLLEREDLRVEMSAAMLRMARPEAASVVASLISKYWARVPQPQVA